MPSGAHLDVGRFQIAMNDPLLVGRFERLRDLLRDRQRLVERNRPACDAIGQRRPFDQFHDERAGAATLFEPVDGGDVRMVQRGEGLGFALEARETFGIGREGLGQRLLIATSRSSFVSRAR